MSFYANADQLYECVGALFERVLEEHPNVAQDILASHMVIHLRCTEPEAEFTLNGRQAPVEAVWGPFSQRPDLDVELAADTLHRILLDELSLRKALAGRLLKVRGPVHKVSALAELLRQGRAFYSQVLSEHGLVP